MVDEGVQVVEAAEQRVGDLPALRGAGAAAVEKQLRVVHALGAQVAAQPPGGRLSEALHAEDQLAHLARGKGRGRGHWVRARAGRWVRARAWALG